MVDIRNFIVLSYLQESIHAFTSCLERRNNDNVRQELDEVRNLRCKDLAQRVGYSGLRIQEDIGGCNGPGCVVWECGIFLSWYLMNKAPQLVKGRGHKNPSPIFMCIL